MADNTGKGDRYVLVYDFMNSPIIRKEAERVAKEKGLKIFSIGDKRLIYCDKNYIFANPQTFLGLIKNATYIVSNSFHGTAFAIIFGIPYTIISREDGLNVRMKELSRLDITRLDEEIAHSKSFLQNIIRHE
jgi:hypothetical protein